MMPASSRPWLRVLILARCVLVARPGEQGKAVGQSAAQWIKEACFRWRAVEEPLLWQETLGELKERRRGRSKQPPLQENNARRAWTLIQEG